LSVILFKGFMAGPHWNQSGSGSNYLCLHEEPQWNSYRSSSQSRDAAGSIHGVQYELYNSGQNQNNVFLESDSGLLERKSVPCAFCYVGGRSAVAMIPARMECPDGWTKEYGGYLASDARVSGRIRSSYICLDEAPEVASSRQIHWLEGTLYPVEVQCGTLPCSSFASGRELTCVLCSK